MAKQQKSRASTPARIQAAARAGRTPKPRALAPTAVVQTQSAPKRRLLVPVETSDDLAGKASDAFRTISEVSDTLDVPKHVLRFWEGRFAQLKPMKRGGGRRFYRPEDVGLLTGIRHLLHNSGYTIRGVQQLLRKNGVEWVKKAGAGTVTVPVRSGEDPVDRAARRQQLEGLVREVRQCLALLGVEPRVSGATSDAAAPESKSRPTSQRRRA